MQLKGLVRFFTVLLIIYSLYQLSFTWFVRNHEKKLAAQAKSYVNALPSATAKYPNDAATQMKYQDTLDKIYEARLAYLEDSTKDVTLTYGINGAMSYQKSKEEELNLGLDLQGGMNVMLEVEMSGLLKSLANNSKDPNFLAALKNADSRKANSDADFITLFIQEYRKLEAKRPLAALFAGASSGKIDINTTDSKVETYVREEAKTAYDVTFDRLSTRIDQFGVAQPTINALPDRQLINVELPGIKDKERVRKLLQSTANLQFWEVYTLQDNNYASGWNKAVELFNAKYGNKKDSTSKVDTTKKTDTSAVAKTSDTSGKSKILSEQIANTGDTVAKSTEDLTAQTTIEKYIQFAGVSRDEAGNVSVPPYIGNVLIRDTAKVRGYLDELRANFPADVAWAYGTPFKDQKGKTADAVPLYALKTFGRPTAKLEGDAIANANMSFDQYGKVEVQMEMKNFGAVIWKKMTEDAAGDPNNPNDNKPIAIVLDNVVFSAHAV